MKWEPKRKRAAEEGGFSGRDTAIAGTLAATAIASAIAPKAMGKALGFVGKGAAKFVAPALTLASGANLYHDRLNGSKRAQEYQDKVLAGEQTTVGEGLLAPVDYSMKYANEQEENAYLHYYREAAKVLRNSGLTNAQRSEQLAKLAADRDKTAEYKESWLGRKARNFAGTMVGAAGLASYVYDDDEDRTRRKDLNAARAEYDKLLKYGVYERASDDDSRGKIFMDMARKRAANIARLEELAGGAALKPGDERFNPPKTETGAADWTAARDRAVGANQRFEKEFRENYATAYDALLSARRQAIFDNAIAKGLEGIGYKGVTMDMFAQDPRFRADYDRLMGLSLMDLDTAAQPYMGTRWQAPKPVKPPPDSARDLMTGR